ncbi:hypothetical protein Tco_1579798, partial [Tanacetum coccineum]
GDEMAATTAQDEGNGGDRAAAVGEGEGQRGAWRPVT